MMMVMIEDFGVVKLPGTLHSNLPLKYLVERHVLLVDFYKIVFAYLVSCFVV